MVVSEKIDYVESQIEDIYILNLIDNFKRIIKLYLQLELSYSEAPNENIFVFKPLLDDASKNIYRIKLDTVYLLNSVKYYTRETRSWFKENFNENFNNFRSNSSSNKLYGKFIGLITLSIASFYNFVNSLYEKAMIEKMSPLYYITIFESSPIDRDLLDFDTEVNNIENEAYNNFDVSNYFPIVRYATNSNIFEKTVLEYKPDIYHFTCHGDEKILCFVGPGGKTESYESNKFISFLNKYLKYDIRLIYLNACETMSYAAELRRNKNKPVRVYKAMGYMGKNSNHEATIFSKIFYTNLFKIKETNVCLTYQDSKKSFLRFDPYYKREKYFNKLRVCKR